MLEGVILVDAKAVTSLPAGDGLDAIEPRHNIRFVGQGISLYSASRIWSQHRAAAEIAP